MVVPDGSGIFCNVALGAIPKSSVKIGSPEFPEQKPNCALLFSDIKSKAKIVNTLFLNDRFKDN